MLTEKKLKALQPKPRLYRVADSAGLCIEVTPKGSLLWRYRYRYAGHAKMISLGKYPSISLKQARDRRDDARRALADNKDPSAERASSRRRAKVSADNTFKAVASEWLGVQAHNWTPGQTKKERERLDRHAFPWIGKMPVDSISVSDIRPLLDRLVQKGHHDQARRLRQEISRVFRFAVATERADRDPAHDLRDVLPGRGGKSYATMTDPEQVGRLLRAIDGYSGNFAIGCALKLAPLLFVRPGELRGAEWSEINFNGKDGPVWSIPPARRKLRKASKFNSATAPHVVPLSDQAQQIIRELHAVTGDGRFLFPSVRGKNRSISDNTINAALRRLGYDKTEITGHGFRHMASTLLHEQGVDGEVIERQLSHKEAGVAGVYNKSQRLPERRIMMQRWADYLDALKKQQDFAC